MEAAAAATSLSAGVRRGPWTVEEDMRLVGYVGAHGEGRWNRVAERAGLRRTGKSCRLRWLNYLRPGVRRGNITPEEQLLILDLHSRWGNRWSKIAAFLPGRTDNEIKNYWRTRVQRHANHLNCRVDSHRFREAVRTLWMPRLIDRIRSHQQTASFPHLPMATEAAAQPMPIPPPQPSEGWFEEDYSAVPSDLFWSPDEPNSWLEPTTLYD